MAQQAAHQQKRGPSASRMRWPELSKPRTAPAQGRQRSKPSDSLQLENSEKIVSRTPGTETAAAGVGGAACADGVLPSAAKPLECLCEGTEWLEQDPQRQFEEDVVRFLRAACEGPVSEAVCHLAATVWIS